MAAASAEGMTSRSESEFDPDCRRCPRLAVHLDGVRAAHPHYHAAPVPSFGDPRARLLIVGLAPGMHGANATGRPFTGDHAGILLYATLHRLGLADRPQSIAADDGLRLRDCRITNAVKCLPPGNKPSIGEVSACNGFLAAEIRTLGSGSVLLALGRIAHRAVLRALGRTQVGHPFAHGAEYRLPEGLVLIDSYHCSRYNTQTGRLTESMFQAVLERACVHLAAPNGECRVPD
jgi:uracil-DNA glycosylase family 4